MKYDLDQMQALSMVVRLASFHRAADQLLVTQSAVSQRIKALEAIVGQPLLIRSSPPRPTKMGQRVVTTFEQIESLLDTIDGTGASRPVAIGANVESFETWLGPRLAELAIESGVLFNVKLADQDKTLEMLKDGDVIACVSSSKASIHGCSSYPLGAMTYCCISNRQFAKKFRLTKNKKEHLLSAPSVVYGPFDYIQERFLKDVLGVAKTPAFPFHSVPSLAGMLEFVNSGAVYGMLPLAIVAEELRDGRLIDLFPKYKMKIPLFWHIVQTPIPLLNHLERKIKQAKII